MARRHGAHPAQRPGHAARRDDAVRHLLDARRLRRAAHDRQHVASTSSSRSRAIPTTSPARAGCASWSTRATAGGCSPCRRPSRSGSATAAGSTGSTTGPSRCGRSRPATSRRCSGASRSRASPAASWSSAIWSSASASSTTPAGSRSTPPRKRFAFRPDPAFALGPALSGGRLPPGHQHARRGRGDRRRRAALRRRQAARRRLRGAADAADERVRLRRRGLDDRSRGGRAPRDANTRRGVDEAAMLAPAARYWAHVTRGLRIAGNGPGVAALDTIFPWLAHDAMIHLTVPHGLEQYTRRRLGHARRLPGPGRVPAGARARRAGQGDPADRLRAAARVARRLAAMVHARALRRDPGPAQPWRRHRLAAQGALRLCRGDRTTSPSSTSRSPGGEDDAERTAREDPVAAHVDKLLATVRERFIPGTRLIRYGEGDWNNSLQPADPTMRDWMVSSWTVALLFQQLAATPRS